MFVIRNQGYFYTDEYFAPDGGFHRVNDETYDTREEADAALLAHCRMRMRRERLYDFLFDDVQVNRSVTAYFAAEFPDAYDYDSNGRWMYEQDGLVPEEATDAQVDEVLARSKIVFAKVFEYDEEVDEAELDPMLMEDLYFGTPD